MKFHPNGKPMAYPKPPKILGPVGRTDWNDFQRDLGGVTDQGGKTYLETACRCADDIQRMRERVKRDGDVIRDRWGQLKSHPLLASIRGLETVRHKALRALNLDIAPVKGDK